MRHYFYHTDLGQQNAVFHNFAIQIAIIQYSGRSKHAWALAKPLKKKNSEIVYTASRFWLLQCQLWRAFEWTLTQLRSNIIRNLLCLFFILKWFNARHFDYSGKRCSLNDWKQSAQRLKLQERLLIINKRNLIRWNIYRDDNFHSERQVLKCF